MMKMQTQFGKNVKFVRHDGAREFVTNSLHTFYEDEGIEQQTTVPYAKKRHGGAIHPNDRHDWLPMLHHAKMDKCFGLRWQ